ncbi:YciI family protein [Lentzea sp. NPDC003310]|uniref:YciI family protein n=1 Tax=Lentzea sp. NPDC003310 TaxID=3154447 RepID=UPI0033A29DF2
MKFVTIGYGERSGYDSTDPAVRDAAHAHDARLLASGVEMGVAGRPVQVRNPGGTGTEVGEGAFMTSAMPVAGFAIIEAESLEEAVRLVSGTPCAVAHGVVEVWPLQSAQG